MRAEITYDDGVDEAVIARTFGGAALDFGSYVPTRMEPIEVSCGLSEEWGTPEVVVRSLANPAGHALDFIVWMFTCEAEAVALDAFVSDGTGGDPGLQVPRPLASFGEPVALDEHTWWQPPVVRRPHVNGLKKTGDGGVYWAVPIRILARRPGGQVYASCHLGRLFPHEAGYFDQLAEALAVLRSWTAAG